MSSMSMSPSPRPPHPPRVVGPPRDPKTGVPAECPVPGNPHKPTPTIQCRWLVGSRARRPGATLVRRSRPCRRPSRGPRQTPRQNFAREKWSCGYRKDWVASGFSRGGGGVSTSTQTPASISTVAPFVLPGGVAAARGTPRAERGFAAGSLPLPRTSTPMPSIPASVSPPRAGNRPDPPQRHPGPRDRRCCTKTGTCRCIDRTSCTCTESSPGSSWRCTTLSSMPGPERGRCRRRGGCCRCSRPRGTSRNRDAECDRPGPRHRPGHRGSFRTRRPPRSRIGGCWVARRDRGKLPPIEGRPTPCGCAGSNSCGCGCWCWCCCWCSRETADTGNGDRRCRDRRRTRDRSTRTRRSRRGYEARSPPPHTNRSGGGGSGSCCCARARFRNRTRTAIAMRCRHRVDRGSSREPERRTCSSIPPTREGTEIVCVAAVAEGKSPRTPPSLWVSVVVVVVVDDDDDDD
mmetsp:Transcript_16006/g.34667  ORF Transcript_16006/g.34667 Transcript_16006/m.34667 type:complete len:460 (+) Transcript_16006:823-2202(+)